MKVLRILFLPFIQNKYESLSWNYTSTSNEMKVYFSLVLSDFNNWLLSNMCYNDFTVSLLIFIQLPLWCVVWAQDGLTRHSVTPGSVDWEPAWHGRSPASLWQCACTGPGGWREAWWRTSRKHPQSSCTRFEGGNGSQKPDDPASKVKECSETLQETAEISLFLPRAPTLRICGVLTVLILTLMTGISERHDDEGSGLSAFMFTLRKISEDVTVNSRVLYFQLLE